MISSSSLEIFVIAENWPVDRPMSSSRVVFFRNGVTYASLNLEGKCHEKLIGWREY